MAGQSLARKSGAIDAVNFIAGLAGSDKQITKKKISVASPRKRKKR